MKSSTIHNRIKDENVLVDQCKSQNPAAQKKLYEKYYGKMYPLCLRYLKNEEETAEVVNTGFLKVFNKIHKFKSESSLQTWMKRIFINTAIDFIRKNKEYKKRFIKTNEFSFYGHPKEDNGNISLGTNEHFTSQELLEILKELPPATRVVFNLHAIDEFTHKEIAAQLKISVGTSKWHLSNARKILSEKIKMILIYKNNNEEYGTQII